MNKRNIARLINLPIKTESRIAIISLFFGLSSEEIAEFANGGSAEDAECLSIHLSFEHANIDSNVLKDVKSSVQKLAILQLKEKQESLTEKEIVTKATAMATSVARDLSEESRAYVARRKEIVSGLGKIGSDFAIRALFEKASKMFSDKEKSCEESTILFHILRVLNSAQNQNLVKELLEQEKNPYFEVMLNVNRDISRTAKDIQFEK